MKNFTQIKSLLLLIAFTTLSLISYGQKYTGLTAVPSDGTSNTEFMFDNNMGTRWQDASNLDEASFVVDLGEVKNINSIKIYWEGANAKAYTLSASTNNSDFTEFKSYTDLAAGARTDLISALDIDCRYIKFQGVTRQLPYGYSIYEFEVFPAVAATLTSLTVEPETSSILLGVTKQFTAGGLDQIGNDFTLTNATTWEVDGTGASIDANGLFSSTSKGFYTVTATNSGISKTATIDVLPANDNLSIGATATASTGNAAAAIDNNEGTRWESASEDPQWIMVDLGSSKKITDIIISWEAANSKDYIIETSLNASEWTTLVTKTDMPEGLRTDRMYDFNVEAQYVRLTGTARNLIYGHSIWEFKIFGTVSTTTLYPFISKNNTISVYPNPVSDMLNVSGEVSEIAILSLQGQLLKSTTNQNFIPVSDLSKGLCIVRVTNKAGVTESTKLVIR